MRGVCSFAVEKKTTLFLGAKHASPLTAKHQQPTDPGELLKRRAASRGLRKAFTAFGHERQRVTCFADARPWCTAEPLYKGRQAFFVHKCDPQIQSTQLEQPARCAKNTKALRARATPALAVLSALGGNYEVNTALTHM